MGGSGGSAGFGQSVRGGGSSSGGANQGGAGGGGGSGGTSCEDYVIETRLWSPSPDAVGQLEIGDVLDVELDEDKVVVVDEEGTVVGTIVERGKGRLHQCLAKGYEFAATVKSVSGGSVVVSVRAV